MTGTALTLYHSAVSANADGDSDRARKILEQALSASPDVRLRARIQHLRSRIEMWSDAPLRAYEFLLTEAEAVAKVDARRCALMLAEAAFAAVSAGELDHANKAAARAYRLAARLDTATRAATELVWGICRVLTADKHAGERLIQRAARVVFRHRADADIAPLVRRAVGGLYWIEEYSAADTVLDELIGRARRHRDPLLSNWLDTRAAIAFRVGRWTAADAASAEALRLATELGQSLQAASCRTTLARIAAAQGRDLDCRRYVSDALRGGVQSEIMVQWAISALGLLELGLGRAEAASEELEKIARPSAAGVTSDPAIAQAITDLAEAYVRAGRESDALELLRRWEPRALRTRRTWAAATLLRCQALVAKTADFAPLFERALSWHDRSTAPFDRARTELCYGERLRRARRRGTAAIHLRAALATFENLGARPWAERASRELLAAGRERRGAGVRDVLETLTAHERQVATLAARGLRNRQIASTLFITERTVEFHLTNIYEKLGVVSRTQLTVLSSRAGVWSGAAPAG